MSEPKSTGKRKQPPSGALTDSKKGKARAFLFLWVSWIALIAIFGAWHFGVPSAPRAESGHASHSSRRSLPLSQIGESRSPASSKAPHEPADASTAVAQLKAKESDLEACAASFQRDVEPARDFMDRYLNQSSHHVQPWFFDYVLKADGSKGPLTHPAADAETSASGKFLLGLAKAGYLDGDVAVEANPAEAMQLLKSASEMEPGNSAPLIYLAMLQKKQGLIREEATTLALLAQSTHYESHVKEMANEVFESVRTPSDYVNALSVWGRMPIPNMNKDFQNYLIDHNSARVAEQLASSVPKGDSVLLDLDWVPVEGAVGVSLVRKLAPQSKFAMSKESFHDLMQRAVDNSMLGNSDIESSCNIVEIWPEVQKLQAHFAKQK